MYINYIDHDKFGRLWFRIDMRNARVMGYTEEQNRQVGPICELLVLEYGVSSWASTPQEAIQRLIWQLDAKAERGIDLPPVPKLSFWTRWRLYRLGKLAEKNGLVNPVRVPR